MIRTLTGLHHTFYSLLIFIRICDINKRLLDDATSFPSDIQDDIPFFPLVEQISSLLFNSVFPSLWYIHNLSCASHSMHTGLHPETRMLKFGLRYLCTMVNNMFCWKTSMELTLLLRILNAQDSQRFETHFDLHLDYWIYFVCDRLHLSELVFICIPLPISFSTPPHVHYHSHPL